MLWSTDIRSLDISWVAARFDEVPNVIRHYKTKMGKGEVKRVKYEVKYRGRREAKLRSDSNLCG